MAGTVFSPGWTPSTGSLQKGGSAVLWGGLVALTGLLLGVLWAAPDLLVAFPVLLIGGAVLTYLLRHPARHLYVVLLASATILHHEPGVQISEVIYGLYVLFFLGVWFLGDVLAGRRPLGLGESRLLAYFLGYVLLLVPLSFMLGGTPHTVVREVTSLAYLGFFFPICAVCTREKNGVRNLIWIGAALLVFVVVRNVLTYISVLNNAERLADMVAGRVVASEHMLSAGALFSIGFLIYARSARQALLAVVGFGATFGALLLSMSRGFWLAFLWGCVLLFWAVERRYRARLLAMGALSIVAVLAVAFLFFGDFASLYIDGLVERVGSVQGSTTSDISMLGRLYEARAALGHIAENPILGHGVGVPFVFTTILTRTQLSTTFVHNGYVYLWYAFGLPGAALMLLIWWRAIRRGLQTFRSAPSRMYRVAGLGVATSLFCYTLSAMTSNPFWHKDYLLGLAFMFGMAYGTHARVQQQATSPPLASETPLAAPAG